MYQAFVISSNNDRFDFRRAHAAVCGGAKTAPRGGGRVYRAVHARWRCHWRLTCAPPEKKRAACRSACGCACAVVARDLCTLRYLCTARSSTRSNRCGVYTRQQIGTEPRCCRPASDPPWRGGYAMTSRPARGQRVWEPAAGALESQSESVEGLVRRGFEGKRERNGRGRHGRGTNLTGPIKEGKKPSQPAKQSREMNGQRNGKIGGEQQRPLTADATPASSSLIKRDRMEWC